MHNYLNFVLSRNKKRGNEAKFDDRTQSFTEDEVNEGRSMPDVF